MVFGSEQLTQNHLGKSITTFPNHFDTDSGVFTNTAAIPKNLDMVVTSDTTLAHLAGAVFIQTRLLLGNVPDWCWLQSESSTPWYPSMSWFWQRKAWDVERTRH